MNNILKKSYEISLWDDLMFWVAIELEAVSLTKEKYSPEKYYSVVAELDEGIYCQLDKDPYNENKTYYSLKKEGAAKKDGPNASDLDGWGPGQGKPFTRFQYYKEKKLCVIGSNTMSAPVRAVKPKLVSKVNGENTLTFTVYSHYWDEDVQKLQWNPFMMYLTNERKVKLKYDGKWYDFIIKNISEDSSSKAFTYTCKDLFVNELSKTGFELEFDNELGNNMGNLPTLAEKILEGSDWQLKSDSTETVKQYLEEPLYEITLGDKKTFTVLYGPDDYNYNYNYTIEASKGQKIYVFYSSFEYRKDEGEEEETLKILANPQFLYDPKQVYTPDDKNVIIGYDEDEPDGALNCTYNGTFSEVFAFCDNRRGERLVKSQKTYFDPKLKRTVNVYNDGAVYGYKTSEYISPVAVQSYVTNPSSFTNTTGWNKGKASTGTSENFPGLELEVYPELDPVTIADDSYNGHSYLKFSAQVVNQVLMNSGLNNNRTSIGSFTKGEKYVFSLEAYSALSTSAVATNYEIIISEYDFQDSVYTPVLYKRALITEENFEANKSKLYIYANNNYTEVSLDSYYSKDAKYYYHYPDGLFTLDSWDTETVDNKWKIKSCIATCQYSISEEEYKKKNIGIFIKAKSTAPIYIKEMQFYPYKTTDSGTVVKPGDTIEAVVKEQWCYYSKDATYTSEKDLEYLFKGETQPTENGELVYKPYYGNLNKPEEAYEKVRSITAKESNRFNLLQSLCELFENWIEFEIEHDDTTGQISIDENYRQKKWVSYRKYIGQDNHVGFKYGINLKSIKRTLDSNGTISKIIVKDNSNEFAPHGYCSIARAEENLTGENSIYNFDYYVGQGLINFSTLNNDLYFQPNNPQGYLGYYKSLKVLNNEAQEIIETLSDLITDISKYSSQYQTYTMSVNAAEQDKAEQENKFEELTGVSFLKAIPEYQKYDKEKHKNSNLWKRYSYNEENDTYTEDASGDFARLKWWDNSEAKKIYQAIARDIVTIKDHDVIAKNQKKLQDAAIAQQIVIENRLKEIREAKLEINKRFYKKYSRFIQEGSWISEDYIDDNLYYIDALSSLYTSSRPQVNYTIDVIELSQLEGYENFKFALGDKTYVEDKEFFGWAYDGSKRLYREEVIVSEMTLELDSPESNKIKVQNYKTQFEDLFQRVVATTQQVQFSTGEYQRSAAIVEPGGTINVTTLQNSFMNNAITLQNVKDQSVIIGDDGITTTNLSRPSEIVRITSGGIFLSENGGESWTAGITAGGINASCITSGQINASEINITMGGHAAFRWDKLGISAYRRNSAGISPGIFTRFDQFGIYGVNGDKDFDALKKNETEVNTVDEAMAKIKGAASFGLTWDGFWLKSNGTNAYISISSNEDFKVVQTVTSKSGEKKDIDIIKIGRLGGASQSDYYGIRIKNKDDETVLETNQDGTLWLKNILHIETYNNKEVKIGKIDMDGTSEGSIHGGRVIDANDTFKVYEDGHVVGTSVSMVGENVEIQGNINATGGTIGGLTIETWKDGNYSVRINTSKGTVFKKDEDSTLLTATLYYGGSPATGLELKYQWYYLGLIEGGQWGEIDITNANSSQFEVLGENLSTNEAKTYGCKITIIPQEE